MLILCTDLRFSFGLGEPLLRFPRFRTQDHSKSSIASSLIIPHCTPLHTNKIIFIQYFSLFLALRYENAEEKKKTFYGKTNIKIGKRNKANKKVLMSLNHFIFVFRSDNKNYSSKKIFNFLIFSESLIYRYFQLN